jgi:tRNA-splicing endonuclease subunit Sen34
LPTEIAVLVDDASAHLPPTDLQVAAHAEAEKVEMARQGALSEARIAAESRTQANSEAAQRKRAEREAKKAAKVAAVASQGDVASLLVTSDTPGNPKPARTDTPTSTSAGYTTPYTVQIPASSSSLPWYGTSNLPANNSTIYDSLETARAAGVWTYPTTDAQRARCAVFRDLWEKDYFMGGGIKFGGDYLVYPGGTLHHDAAESFMLTRASQAILCATTRTLSLRRFETTSR